MSALRARNRRKAAAAALVLLAGLPLVAWPAGGHEPGAAPLYQSGNATLAPAGAANSTIHAYLDALGLPTNVGDRLEIAFAVENGTGAPILFEIHTHSELAGYKVYYNKTAASLRDNWTVAEDAGYMVYFENPHDFSVFLSYSFVLRAPASAASALLFIFPATAGLALGWFFFVRAGRGLPPETGGGAQDEEGMGGAGNAGGEAEGEGPEGPSPKAKPPPGP